VDTLVITLRVALSLGVVLALMWVLHRRVSRGQFGAGKKPRGRRSAAVEVVARQGIGGKASVVVVDVEGERLVLGVTEHGVSLLTSGEAPAPELTIVTGPVTLPVRPTPSAEQFRQELAVQTDATTSLPSDAAEPLPMRPRNRRAQRTVVPTSAQLQGSILSADTWRQAAAALRSRRAG
jgi:flagellar protein FliO/FliZ